MAVIALLLAGGSGLRMQDEVPKQFIIVNEKPVIVYSLEVFEKHPEVDSIAVVCLSNWERILWSYAREYGISKLKHVVSGGRTGQESIRNGVFELERHFSDDDIVMIHDAIRPLVSPKIISDNLEVARKYGNAITAIPCVEAILQTKDGVDSHRSIPRESLRRTQTPQSFHIKDICDLHRRALEKRIENSVASCVLMVEMNEPVYFSEGSEKNIKLTVKDDLDIFKALLATKLQTY